MDAEEKKPEARSQNIPASVRDGIYYCPCGASHSRSPFDWVNLYRCLACGGCHRVLNNTFKLYLVGPMTGLSEFNYPAFHRAAAQLRAAGYEVVNPAEVNVDTSISWQAAMRRDVPAMLTCDAIAYLPKWFGSRGATLKIHIASNLGMPVESIDMWLQAALEKAEDA
jgi:uncharacterized protein DUF4406